MEPRMAVMDLIGVWVYTRDTVEGIAVEAAPVGRMVPGFEW
jgi:hypothetical protein